MLVLSDSTSNPDNGFNLLVCRHGAALPTTMLDRKNYPLLRLYLVVPLNGVSGLKIPTTVERDLIGQTINANFKAVSLADPHLLMSAMALGVLEQVFVR